MEINAEKWCLFLKTWRILDKMRYQADRVLQICINMELFESPRAN